MIYDVLCYSMICYDMLCWSVCMLQHVILSKPPACSESWRRVYRFMQVFAHVHPSPLTPPPLGRHSAKGGRIQATCVPTGKHCFASAMAPRSSRTEPTRKTCIWHSIYHMIARCNILVDIRACLPANQHIQTLLVLHSLQSRHVTSQHVARMRHGISKT